MKTDHFIDMLSRGAGPAPHGVVARRLSPAVVAGLLVSIAVAIGWFGAIPLTMWATAVPWGKLVYALALAGAAAWLTVRLSRPAAPWHLARTAVLLVMGAMTLVGLASLWLAAPSDRLGALLGDSWLVCPWRVIALSLPALAAVLWAVRGLAPTQLRAAGWAAGMLAGAVGAAGYSLSCTESSPAFVAVWYTLGIVLTGWMGAVLGPRVLRW